MKIGINAENCGSTRPYALWLFSVLFALSDQQQFGLARHINVDIGTIAARARSAQMRRAPGWDAALAMNFNQGRFGPDAATVGIYARKMTFSV